jgi:hypothetical protein
MESLKQPNVSNRRAAHGEAQRLAVELAAAAPPLYCRYDEIKEFPASRALLNAPADVQREFIRYTLDCLGGLRDKLGKSKSQGLDWRYCNLWHVEGYPSAFIEIARHLFRRKLEFSGGDVAFLCERLAYLGIVTVHSVPIAENVVALAENHLRSHKLDDELRSSLERLQQALGCIANAPERKLRSRVQSLLKIESGEHSVLHQISLQPGETWSDKALEQLKAMTVSERIKWLTLFDHCQSASGGMPSSKWLREARDLRKSLVAAVFKRRVLIWLALVNEPRTQPINDWNLEWQPDPNQLIIEPHSDILKGLAWCCGLREDAELARALTALALSAYRKIPKKGPREVKVGNACVTALGMMPGMEGVGQLALLKVRVKFGTAQKMIEKALEATATRVGLPREELEEMAVPAYGLTEVGRCTEALGDYTAELSVTGTSSTEIVWLKADGKRQQSVPAVVKEKFAEELKELQGAAKDIQRMLPAQRERIDSLFLQQKRWPFAVWRERYLDHPLVGVLARRLLWVFTNEKKNTTGVWFNGQFVDIDLKPVKDLGAETTVSLWHPIGRDLDEIVGWRAWLDAQQIQQPFKQAHREVYVLTDAERRTNTYSNRFAAHLLKQHQFNALAALRGWKNKLRLAVDAEFPPATRLLPQWELRAEFWIEGVGDDYGTDINETGTYLRVATDQVRFYPIAAPQVTGGGYSGPYSPRHGETAAEPIPLEEVPALVFSEIMRDVDLFVGVASVGNDPAWSDGGPEGRYREYWQSYSFGTLSATAQTRKDVLQRLVPRLKIAGQCSFADKFLVVKGSLRTYKIHLGSGNILMEPNDQYLCIVPDRGSASAKAGERVFLPFEGDSTLSVILSKAFLLAEDREIKDETIRRQIMPK